MSTPRQPHTPDLPLTRSTTPRPPDTKVYHGIRTAKGCRVTVDGRPLPMRLDIMSYSPTGYDWGYSGAGAAQLALAVLADYLHDDRCAVRWHQAFKTACVALLPAAEWTLTGYQVLVYLRSLEPESRTQGKEGLPQD